MKQIILTHRWSMTLSPPDKGRPVRGSLSPLTLPLLSLSIASMTSCASPRSRGSPMYSAKPGSSCLQGEHLAMIRPDRDVVRGAGRTHTSMWPLPSASWQSTQSTNCQKPPEGSPANSWALVRP
jgi:hypothetical protein